MSLSAGPRARAAAVASLLAASVTIAGCASPPPRGPVYLHHQAQSAWDVKDGRVVDVQSATIEGRRTSVGRVGGGLVGYEVGRSVGQGTGSRIGGAVGAVAGAVAGEAIEEGATRQRAWAITVELDSGRTLQIVQPADQQFAVGEKVRVYTRRDDARVGKI